MNKYFIETFGCQMNKYDSELVASILNEDGFERVKNIEESDIILINTCSVRENAESRVKNKLDSYRALRKKNQTLIIGILGCMAERLGERLIAEKSTVNFVLGPDGYRKLPEILDQIYDVSSLAADRTDKSRETYTDIFPSRFGKVSAWVAIMRGCNNFCSYCIVPYVRGRERSRPHRDILDEVRKAVGEGFVEVTLLGQNVNSYQYEGMDFPDLLDQTSQIAGLKRVRFATSHPKDLSTKLIQTIAKNDRLCNHVHLAVQSGSNRILKLMNRNYTREHFMALVDRSRDCIGNPGIYTDVIVGFPGETENDFLDTLDLVDRVQFDGIFSFKYSPREGTAAFQFDQTVTDEEKLNRLEQLNHLQDKITLERNRKLIGTVQNVLVEGPDKKRRQKQLMGRTDTNKIVVFPETEGIAVGSLVDVGIINAEGHTLFGRINGASIANGGIHVGT